MSRSDRDEFAPPDGRGLRIAVVRSTFNSSITDGLLEGALDLLAEAEVSEVQVVDVPGAFELPLVAQALAQAGHDAIVAIGAVIEGETDHYEHIAHRASEGLTRVMLDTGIPIAFGVLTVRDPAHALARSTPGEANKGREAAATALEVVHVLRTVREM